MNPPATVAAPAVRLPEFDPRDLKGYSPIRALQIAGKARKGRGSLEQDVHDALAAKMPMGGYKGFLIPTAALTSDTATAGQELVFERPLTFVEALRARSTLARLGAQVVDYPLPSAYPTETLGGGATWRAENPGADLADGDMTTGNVQLALRMLQAGSGFTRQLLTQSRPAKAADQAVIASIAADFAVAFDLAGISGAGSASNEPTGILNTTGINVVALGTNGAVPTYDDMTALEEAVAIDDGDLASLGFLTTPEIRRLLRKTERAAGSGMVWDRGGMLDYPGEVSTSVPSNLTKGTGTNLHAVLYGAWSQLVLAHLGAVDVVVDPFTAAKQGLVEVASYLYCDIGVLHPVSFAAIKDAALS